MCSDWALLRWFVQDNNCERISRRQGIKKGGGVQRSENLNGLGDINAVVNIVVLNSDSFKER